MSFAHFSSHCWVNDYPETVIAANEMEKRLRSQGRNDAADMVILAMARLKSELQELGTTMAKRGTEILREIEQQTRVRPDTHGGGGKRLENYLVCEVLVPSVLPGTIGINDEALLDANVRWWPTNEAGSSTQIGRSIFGLFYGDAGDAPPSQDEFREHPLFTPAPYAAGGGPGTIEHGIPERRFVRRATQEIEREWLAAFEAIDLHLLDAIDAAAMTFR